MIDILLKYFPQLLNGFWVTIESSIIALFGSLILGTIFAVMQVSRNKITRIISETYVEIFRNIPLLVITLFFFAFVAPVAKKIGLPIDGFTAGTIGLTLYTSAFIAEVIRSGINSISSSQMEGAVSNGLSWWQAMRYIVLPQAFKISIPNLGNQFVNLVKNSSVLAFVAGLDLMYNANSIAQNTFDSLNTYFIVAIFYLIITMPISYYMKHLEQRFKGGAH
ncbi:MAG: amino acid ABC transporter permease [Lactobacillaceae bacterium]|jgi:putative glutamine transport system permease protein|nr:amino acid ABC transporter permease [Lactobacillaceae bacterium]